MGQYQRITLEEREEISRQLSQGRAVGAIAAGLGRHASTISREVHRGSGNRWTYRAARAQQRAERNARRRKAGQYKFRHHRRLWAQVRRKLLRRWSPKQIAQWLRQRYPTDVTRHVAPETIYTYLYVLPRGQLKAALVRALRQGHKRRRRRGQGPQEPRTCALADMVSIDERPSEVADRCVPGHWEGDLLIGKNRQSCLGTLVERTTRTVLLVPLKNKQARTVRAAFARTIKRLPQHMRLTLTYDQGREMADHRLFTQATQMQVYFAHPASPWERGTNENTNGLIRQFFPKGTDFTKITRYQVHRVQHLLNERPRAVLGWQSPYDAMQALLQ